MKTLKKGIHTLFRCLIPLIVCLMLYEMIYFLMDLFVPASAADSRAYFLLSDLLPNLLVFPAVFLWYRADGRRALRGPDRSLETPLSVYLLCAAGFLGIYFLVDTAVSFSGIAEWDTAFQEVDAYFDSLGTAWNVLTAGFVAPVLEETLFRGVISNRIREDWGEGPAVIGSALLFGIYHWNLTQGIVAFAMGIFLAWAYQKTGALFLCICMHAAVNLTATLLLASWDEIPDTPAVDAALLLFCVVSAVLFLRFLRKKPERRERGGP